MASFNKVMLMGNLTRDPEIRYTPKGTALTEIGLAINRRYQVENETKEEVTFVDVTFWGRQAEVIAQYCKKGRGLFVEGRLQYDTWDDKQTGQKRSRIRVVGENFQFVGQREGGAGEGGDHSGASSRPAPSGAPAQSGSSAGGAPPSGPSSAPVFTGEEEDDQIPF